MTDKRYIIAWGVEGIQYYQIVTCTEREAYNMARDNANFDGEELYPDEVFGGDGVDIYYAFALAPDSIADMVDDLPRMQKIIDNSEINCESIKYDAIS